MILQARKALVTGSSGFIGQALCKHLEEQGYEVVELHRSSERRLAQGRERIVADLALCKELRLPAGIDTVFHLAGKAHALTETEQEEQAYDRINVGGTRLLLEAARIAQVRSFVFFSSVKAVGARCTTAEALDESWTVEPETPYGRSKKEAEQLVLGGGIVPHPAVLRPCLVYGPNPKGNLERMIRAVVAGRFPPIPEVENCRSMVHVDDLARAAILAATRPEAAGKTYIVADCLPFSTRQLYEWMCQATSRPIACWTVPLWVLRMLAMAGDLARNIRGKRIGFDSDALEKLIGNACYSSHRLQSELGWAPKHTIRESLGPIVLSMDIRSR